ncbi:hypothetical protein [Paenibacillus chitinolyticus]
MSKDTAQQEKQPLSGRGQGLFLFGRCFGRYGAVEAAMRSCANAVAALT